MRPTNVDVQVYKKNIIIKALSDEGQESENSAMIRFRFRGWGLYKIRSTITGFLL